MKYAAELREHVRCGSQRPSPGKLGEENAAPAQRPAGTDAGHVLLPFHQPPPRMEGWMGGEETLLSPPSPSPGAVEVAEPCGAVEGAAPAAPGRKEMAELPPPTRPVPRFCCFLPAVTCRGRFFY